MNCQAETNNKARRYLVLSFLAIGSVGVLSGCGGGDSTVATQDELSTFLQANPELENSNASEEEGKARKAEAPEAKAASGRSDA
ncbi:MAG: hypothetical protein ACO1RT_04715 [Planctomycetaceae bacterium]